MAKDCPCGSKKSLESCCLPYIEGRAAAPTAEALMRSRYTAFALARVDYIIESHHSTTRGEVAVDAVKDWAERAEWLGLEIQETQAGGPNDETGSVRFLARYREKGVVRDHLEDARFERENGVWKFVTGTQPPSRRAAPKVGRNDPCPCGSGKKFKKCCGEAA
jgi:SEC-C motif-containing protein